MAGMECKPSVYTDETGKQIADYNNPVISGKGGWATDMNDFQYSESTGETVYRVGTDMAEQQENPYGDYLSALQDAFPIKEMEAYANTQWTQEQFNDFNNLIASGDIENLNVQMELLREQMEQDDSYNQQFQAEEQPGDDFSDDQVADIESAFPVEELKNYLMENYPEETLETFDAVVSNGSYEQVQELYAALYNDYLEAGAEY